MYKIIKQFSLGKKRPQCQYPAPSVPAVVTHEARQPPAASHLLPCSHHQPSSPFQMPCFLGLLFNILSLGLQERLFQGHSSKRSSRWEGTRVLKKWQNSQEPRPGDESRRTEWHQRPESCSLWNFAQQLRPCWFPDKCLKLERDSIIFH